jgi:hypothetical protein
VHEVRLLVEAAEDGCTGLHYTGADARQDQRGQNHGEPFIALLSCCRGDCKRDAEDQAGDESTKVAPVIDAGDRRAKSEIEDDEEDHAAHDLSFLAARNQNIPELNAGNDGSGNAEDGT